MARSAKFPAYHPPVKKPPGESKVVFVRLEAKDLRLITRAAYSMTPPHSISWFTLQAALKRAKEVLAA